jgi:hypothetical protein
MENNTSQINNRGTGAGGANTNRLGKKFEEETLFFSKLTEEGFKQDETNKKMFIRENDDSKITFVIQSELKNLLRNIFELEIFRNPDEAYLVEKDGQYILKILEKKEQNREGSVETKLWAAPSLKKEYQIICGDLIKVEYSLCLSPFLKEKMISDKRKYQILNQILEEDNIKVFFGKDDDYFDKLLEWVYP